jgi:hypothetical protein
MSAFRIALRKTIITMDILFRKVGVPIPYSSHNYLHVFLNFTIIGTIVFGNTWQVF